MEACASSHFWAREIEELGHCVRLVPPIYVKPFVKRHKNDAVDADAITVAATRPTMWFVPIKSPDQRARAMVFRTRDLFVRQRTKLINALRGHLAQHGLVAARVPAQLSRLLEPTIHGQRWPGISSFAPTEGIQDAPQRRPIQALTEDEQGFIRTALSDLRAAFDYD